MEQFFGPRLEREPGTSSTQPLTLTATVPLIVIRWYLTRFNFNFEGTPFPELETFNHFLRRKKKS